MNDTLGTDRKIGCSSWARWQVVVRDLRVEVVHVVEPDVAAEELQHLRQCEVRTAVQCCVVEAPLVGALPVRGLELVLHVEEPDADTAGEDDERELDEQHRLPTECEAQRGDEHHHRHVGEPHAAVHLLVRRGGLEPLHEDGRVDRPEAEHHERVPVGAVSGAEPPRLRPVLGDGEHRHVADEPTVEIAGGGVMDEVLVAPACERREHEQPERGAEPRVGAAARKERAVHAVVEHDVGAHEEPGRRDREQQHQPVRHRVHHEHRGPQHEEGHQRRRQAAQALPEIGPGVLPEVGTVDIDDRPVRNQAHSATAFEV